VELIYRTAPSFLYMLAIAACRVNGLSYLSNKVKWMLSHTRNLVFILLAYFPATMVSAQTTQTALRTQPNIVFIMADDLGQEGLACYGNDVNRTPNLDRLAQRGMKFNQAYATPLCTPSRVELMTGKYNQRNYLVFGVLEKTEKTFATYLKQVGYVTGIAGKWQLLGSEEQQQRAGNHEGTLPREAGFDEFCLWQVEQLGSRYKNPTITSNTSGTQTYNGQYGPDIFCDWALSFLRKHRNQPFFFYYPMALVHAPFQPTPDSAIADYQRFGEKGSNPKYFRDQVEYMDKLVGRVVDEVTSLGLAENTLIIFTGDNGTGRRVTSLVHGQKIEGGKGQTTRYGTNVPLIAVWPGKIKPGQVNENLVDFTDFLPTLREAAGQSSHIEGLDGISLWKQMLGEASPVREQVFCYYFPQLNNDKKVIWAHDKTWKVYSDGRFYNVAKDPTEQSPLAAGNLPPEAQSARERLTKVIQAQLAGTADETTATAVSTSVPTAATTSADKRATKPTREERKARRKQPRSQ
jgi:arylsulfatase A-like enzyme